ncbi:MAG: hypothetical protein MMC33_008105 [Icmadophila ericetorum]|nr:hypothetical protein [Icmadophila ericetorum]
MAAPSERKPFLVTNHDPNKSDQNIPMIEITTGSRPHLQDVHSGLSALEIRKQVELLEAIYLQLASQDTPQQFI